MRPKKVILFVDSEEDSLTFMLTTNGYRVLSATSAAKAIELFKDHPVDVVLTDFSIPDMDGEKLIRRLKQMAGHIPMILRGKPEDIEGRMHHADAFVWHRRCTAVELLECIKQKSARKRGPRKHIQLLPQLEGAPA